MKVAILAPNIKPNCGRSQMIRNLVDELLQSNIQIHLATNNIELNFSPHNNFTIHKIAADPEKKNLFNLLTSLFRLIKIILRENIQVIHSHHRYYEFIARGVSFITNTPTCITIHSETSNLKHLSYKSDVCIAVSNYLKSFISQYYHVRDIRVINNGTKIFAKLMNKKSDEYFNILTVGNFEAFRGWDVLIKAAAKIRSVPIKICFIGKGNDEDKIFKLAEEYNVKIELLYLKDIPYNNYQSCDILIAPTHISTFGMSIIEAGFLGVPVIASNVGGHKEIISDNYDGLLFESGDSNDLKEKIEFSIENPDIMKLYGSRLRERIFAEYSSAGMAKKYLQLYKELIT